MPSKAKLNSETRLHLSSCLRGEWLLACATSLDICAAIGDLATVSHTPSFQEQVHALRRERADWAGNGASGKRCVHRNLPKVSTSKPNSYPAPAFKSIMNCRCEHLQTVPNSPPKLPGTLPCQPHRTAIAVSETLDGSLGCFVDHVDGSKVVRAAGVAPRG